MRRLTLLAIAALFVSLVAAAVQGSNARQRDKLAASGAIEEDAPIKVSLRMEIAAPPAKVWSVLTGIDNWPAWQSGIGEAHIAGPVASGTHFEWSSGGIRIHSTIQLAEPERRIAWTGSAMTAHAVHVWTLEPLPGNRTLVRTDESMSGLLLSHFYSSDQLRASDQLWLQKLKQQAER